MILIVEVSGKMGSCQSSKRNPTAKTETSIKAQAKEKTPPSAPQVDGSDSGITIQAQPAPMSSGRPQVSEAQSEHVREILEVFAQSKRHNSEKLDLSSPLVRSLQADISRLRKEFSELSIAMREDMVVLFKSQDDEDQDRYEELQSWSARTDTILENLGKLESQTLRKSKKKEDPDESWKPLLKEYHDLALEYHVFAGQMLVVPEKMQADISRLRNEVLGLQSLMVGQLESLHTGGEDGDPDEMYSALVGWISHTRTMLEELASTTKMQKDLDEVVWKYHKVSGEYHSLAGALLTLSTERHTDSAKAARDSRLELSQTSYLPQAHKTNIYPSKKITSKIVETNAENLTRGAHSHDDKMVFLFFFDLFSSVFSLFFVF